MGNMHLVTGYAGKEHITAADHGALHSAVFGTGQYVLSKGSRFSASVISNNQIQIADGDIMMQGRHIRLNEGNIVDITIENGAQGKLRNDLIVARYTKDSATGVEDCNLVVIKGEAVESNPADPAYTIGDIIEDHAILNDMPLYRVPLDGLNVGDLVPLFTVIDRLATSEDLAAKANKSITITANLQAAGWTGTEAPYTYPLTVSGVTATSNQEILPALGITTEQLDAMQAANIQDGGQSANTITLKAYGDKPTIDLPIRVIKRGD